MVAYIPGWIPFIFWVYGFIISIGTAIIIPRLIRAIIIRRTLDKLWELISMAPNISIHTMGTVLKDGKAVDNIPGVCVLQGTMARLHERDFAAELRRLGAHVE